MESHWRHVIGVWNNGGEAVRQKVMNFYGRQKQLITFVVEVDQQTYLYKSMSLVHHIDVLMIKNKKKFLLGMHETENASTKYLQI